MEMADETTADPVAIKPLEWVGPGGWYAYKSGFFKEWTAASALGTLCIRYAEHNPLAKPGYRTPPYPPYYSVADKDGKFTTLDDAKAAAQADYEARIRSALALPA